MRFRPLTESHFTLNLACLELHKTLKSFLESCFVLNSFITYYQAGERQKKQFCDIHFKGKYHGLKALKKNKQNLTTKSTLIIEEKKKEYSLLLKQHFYRWTHFIWTCRRQNPSWWNVGDRATQPKNKIWLSSSREWPLLKYILKNWWFMLASGCQNKVLTISSLRHSISAAKHIFTTISRPKFHAVFEIYAYWIEWVKLKERTHYLRTSICSTRIPRSSTSNHKENVTYTLLYIYRIETILSQVVLIQCNAGKVR